MAVQPTIKPPVIQPSAGGVVAGTNGTIADSTGLLSAGVLSVLVNGGTQTSGPITGVAGPPHGVSGVGGEVALCTGTFTLSRSANVMMQAICSNYVTVSSGGFSAAHPIYLQIDGVDDSTAYGYVAVFASGDTETRSQSTTLLKIETLPAGSHTVQVIWNSEEGTHDTIFNGNNPLFVFLLGS